MNIQLSRVFLQLLLAVLLVFASSAFDSMHSLGDARAEQGGLVVSSGSVQSNTGIQQPIVSVPKVDSVQQSPPTPIGTSVNTQGEEPQEKYWWVKDVLVKIVVAIIGGLALIFARRRGKTKEQLSVVNPSSHQRSVSVKQETKEGSNFTNVSASNITITTYHTSDTKGKIENRE